MFRLIQARSTFNAQRWLRQLLKAVHDFQNFAGHARAREADYLETDLRQKVFKSHRIVYSLDTAKKTVTVHYVRHSARRAVGETDDERAEE